MAVAFCPDNHCVFTAGSPVAFLWDRQTGAKLAAIVERGWVDAVAVGVDRLSTATSGDLTTWDMPGRKLSRLIIERAMLPG